MPDLTVLPQPKPTAIEQLVGDYLAACRARGVSPKTIRFSYGYSLTAAFLPWCARQGITEPAQLTSRLLDRYSAELLEQPGKRGQPLAKDTVWTYVKAVKQLLSWANKEGERIQANAQLPKRPQKLPEILSRDEIRRLEDAGANERDALIVRLLADTAIRNDELVKLRLQDLVDHDRRHFLKVQGKGARDRMVPLEPKLYRRLRRYAERQRPADAATERLFVSRRRDRRTGDYEPLTASGIQQLIRELGQKAGIKSGSTPISSGTRR
jgi:site-specific recombinase XerD